MRRLIMFNHVTPEGFFCTPSGSLDWAVQDDELNRTNAAGLSGPGAMLFGRRTYQMFESFWPHVLDDAETAPDPHHPGRRSPELRAMAVWINEAEKIVFSRTLKSVAWTNSRLVPELDPAAVAAIKDEPGSDIMIFGSGSVVTQLTPHGLIDEYQFIIDPLLLGAGRPLFGSLPGSVRLDLLEAKPFPSGNVRLRYVPRK
jgi:dihydrofolate reductase